LIRTAVLSKDRHYRYQLARYWSGTDGARELIGWVMLNPSTADAELDDPTIRRIIGFSKRWGADGLLVANVFSWRETDPALLEHAVDPAGPENEAWLATTAQLATKTVVAWGAGHKAIKGFEHAVLQVTRTLTRYGREPVYCLGTTKAGHPRHPLYVRKDRDLEIFAGYEAAVG